VIDLSYDTDLSQLRGLREVFRASFRRGVERAARRGAKLVAEEAPEGEGLLKGGADFEMSPADGRALEARITMSAVRPPEGESYATLHLPSGKTRQIRLARQPAYDYARAVAEGTGLFGARGQRIEPRRARALRVEVERVEPGESYVSHAGRLFVYRRFVRGMRPNPYDERAARRLLEEAPGIVERALAPLGE
jgi:hypothetical protein